MPHRKRIYGLLAEFDEPEALIAAAKRVHEEGYKRADAYSPFPMDEVTHALGFHKTRVPLVVLIGGLIGGFGGFFMMWYANVLSWPWIVAGRPPNSWPAWIPITFELTILFAGIAALLGMFALNGLPMPYHPLFNVPTFQLASRDRFFICIEARDKKFDLERTREFLLSLRALEVVEVPA